MKEIQCIRGIWRCQCRFLLVCRCRDYELCGSCLWRFSPSSIHQYCCCSSTPPCCWVGVWGGGEVEVDLESKGSCIHFSCRIMRRGWMFCSEDGQFTHFMKTNLRSLQLSPKWDITWPPIRFFFPIPLTQVHGDWKKCQMSLRPGPDQANWACK